MIKWRALSCIGTIIHDLQIDAYDRMNERTNERANEQMFVARLCDE